MRGLLGKATDNFCEDGRLIEKTTYGESQGVVGRELPRPPFIFCLRDSLPDLSRSQWCLFGFGTLSSGWSFTLTTYLPKYPVPASFPGSAVPTGSLPPLGLP